MVTLVYQYGTGRTLSLRYTWGGASGNRTKERLMIGRKASSLTQ